MMEMEEHAEEYETSLKRVQESLRLIRNWK